ncbi:MAG: fasciclin domain-containing protein [Puniceicoccaceae bacterium]
MKKTILTLLSLSLATFAYGHNHGDVKGAVKKAIPAQLDIVDTAVAAGSFKTLAAALEAGGLIETLKEAKDITVFAPTDDAFKALPDGVVEKLLKPENKDTLVRILTYHVLGAKVPAASVSAGTVEMLSGDSLEITTDGGVKVGAANVIKTDVMASNGIIHVIDAVILPEGIEI